MVLPDYIPEPIKTDYLEACAILDASPRAAATLARRCLQGMIRDYWRVKAGNLASEIDLIKDKISADEYRVLNGIRRLGNIGAHMEKDVNLIVDIDPGEAQKLVKVLELLLKDWYIARHDRNELYQEIFEIDQDKQEQRRSSWTIITLDKIRNLVASEMANLQRYVDAIVWQVMFYDFYVVALYQFFQKLSGRKAA